MTLPPCRGLRTALILLATAGPVAGQAAPPSPASVLGYEPGTDSLLADWREIGNYLTQLALASPRVRLDTIGRSTEGRPLLLVTLASPANQRRLPALRAWQARLADPRHLSPAAEDSLVRAAPAVVLISTTIHSTEIAASQMQMTLAWRLAADPAWQPLLDSTVVLILPSPNPDGLDTVVRWYRRYRGTPFEAGPLPWLYHPYAGHDNNRDWFMLALAETRAVTRVLYREWFPQVVWDVHQMGGTGPRLFVPPFANPVNPNLDPILVQATSLIGSAMGAAVLDAGRTGVAHRYRFDLWWHGGFRTVPARHNMIGILSEAASARLASPAYVAPDSLRVPEVGTDYPAPWPGGWWRLGDIVEDELLAARGLLQLLATHRADVVRRFVTLGRRQIQAGRTVPPAAFVVPAEQRDREAAAALLNALTATGIDVLRVDAPFEAAGRRFQAGTHVIPLDQPFRAHVKDLLEAQAYPVRREVPGGPPAEPYDVTGWSLGLQMGVDVQAVGEPITVRATRVDSVAPDPGRVRGTGPQWVLRNAANAESRLIAAALATGARAWVSGAPLILTDTVLPAGSVVLEGPSEALPRLVLEEVARSGFDVWRTSGVAFGPEGTAIATLPRIGVYRSWTASMDEGWTRWVFDRFAIPYATVSDADIRSGNLIDDFDLIVFPDLTAEVIVKGRAPGTVPPEYAGGLGLQGVRNVTEFLTAGGTLVALDGSSDFAISTLNLPVSNTLAQGVEATGGSRFSAPGSIFGVVRDPGALPLMSGLPDTVAAFFAESRAFEVKEPGRVAARYGETPLLSGFVQSPERVAGKAAVVEVDVGRGRVVLIGFRPQHRGQTFGTFKLLFNAVLFGTAR